VDLRQLRTFEAVIRYRTVTDAAVALDLAPSSVSQQIRTLEADLGIPLFRRGPRGMDLTPAGDRLRGWARTLLSQAEQAVREVRAERPRIRLGALETLAGTHVPDVLARLADRHPDVDVDVRADGNRAVLLDGVAAGELDAALLLDSGDHLGGLGFPAPAAPLTYLDLDPVPLALVAVPDHRLAARTALSPADLDGERLLVNVPECSFFMAGRAVFGDGPERVRAGGVPVMRAWAERGLGVSLLPRFAVTDSIEAGRLIALDLPVPDLTLRLVWREDQEAVPGLRDVLTAAASPARPPPRSGSAARSPVRTPASSAEPAATGARPAPHAPRPGSSTR